MSIRALQGNLQTSSANIVNFSTVEITGDAGDTTDVAINVPGVNSTTDMVIALNIDSTGVTGSFSYSAEITDNTTVTVHTTALAATSSIAANTNVKLLIGRFENWTFSALAS